MKRFVQFSLLGFVGSGLLVFTPLSGAAPPPPLIGEEEIPAAMFTQAVPKPPPKPAPPPALAPPAVGPPTFVTPPTPVVAPAKPTAPIKITQPKMQLSLTEREALIVEGDPIARKKLLDQADDYVTKVRELDDSIIRIVSMLQKEQAKIDSELDTFHNKITNLLGNTQTTLATIARYLSKAESLSPQLTQFQTTLISLKKQLQQLQVSDAEIATKEQALIDQIRRMVQQRINASESAIKAGKNLQSLRMALQDKKNPSAYLNEIIEINGELKEANEQIVSAQAEFSQRLADLKTQMQTVQTKTTQLKVEALKLKGQIEAVEKAEAVPAKQEKIVQAKEVEEIIEEQPEIPLQWYEKIIAGVARAALGIRDYARNVLGISEEELVTKYGFTSEEEVENQIKQKIKKLELKKTTAEKVQKKLQDIEAQKAELLQQLKEKQIEVGAPEQEESAKQLFKKMWDTSVALMKKGFLALGYAANRMLEKAARIRKVEKPVEPVQVEPVQVEPIPITKTPPPLKGLSTPPPVITMPNVPAPVPTPIPTPIPTKKAPPLLPG